MRRLAAVLAIGGVAWACSARAADAPPGDPGTSPAPQPSPGADLIQFAAREHDLGYRAYLDKEYDEAASHFENAFFAAPNPAELRSAVRARRDAGELARAATLAAIGQRRFPDDPATNKAAVDVIAQARPHVYEIQITSPVEYSIAVDAKVVTAERAKDTRIFVNPGPHELLVSWPDDRNARIPIDATEGGSESLKLEAPPIAPTPPSPPPNEPAAPPAHAPPPPPVATAEPEATKPFGPVVFIAGASLTTVAAGFTIGSGIETVHTPGANAVRQSCVGLGTPCPLYQEGLRAQLRTNILLATTGALALATAVVGVFFTEWSGPVATSSRRGTSGLCIFPTVGVGAVGAEGTF
jgi:hypothetical protein